MTALNRAPYAVRTASCPIIEDRDGHSVLLVVDPPDDPAGRMETAREIAAAMNAWADHARQSFPIAAE